MKYLYLGLLMAVILMGGIHAQEMSVEKIIEAAYLRDSLVHEEIQDLSMDAVSFSRKLKSDGQVKEEKKFIKTCYFKDTLFTVKFTDYYLDGEKQDEAELQKQIDEMRKKDRMRNAAMNPAEPFYPINSDKYQFELVGIEMKRGVDCYCILADCLLEDKELIEGKYWFETEGMNLVYCEFHPSKLSGPIKEINMNQSRRLTDMGYWLPDEFHLKGRGKVMIFIKFYFDAEEIYSNHKINSGLTDRFFEERENEN